MQWYRNLRIGTKLVSGFVFVALIAGIIGCSASTTSTRSQKKTRTVQGSDQPIVSSPMSRWRSRRSASTSAK